jgi:flagellar FliL protein
MSAAAAEAAPVPAKKPRRKLPKKLVVILAMAGVLLAGGAAATVFVLKQRAAVAAELAGEDSALLDEAAQAEQQHVGRNPAKPPTFLPLDPFVVNLADREQERYAQIGITLQIEDAETAERLKVYMPAIRNGVLMILAHKNSAELLERTGKEQLAAEILRESVRPLGIEVAPEGAGVPGRPRPRVHNPVEKVHFSSFIIQ